MIYRLPLADMGPDGLEDQIFVVSGTMIAHNPTRNKVEPKKWFFDLTGVTPPIIHEEGENV